MKELEAHLGKLKDLDESVIESIALKFLESAKGRDMSCTAEAALRVAFALWAAGGATHEDAMAVCRHHADAILTARQN